jgi:hypothetical protein
MPSANRYIFPSTQDAHAEITHLFDFVFPTAIALWNLRWQVQGFLGQVPNATQIDLLNRFASSSGINGGQLKRTCVETTWEEQLSEFAEFVLINIIATFDDATSRFAEKVGAGQQRAVGRALQYPGSSGWKWALRQFKKSNALAGVFEKEVKKSKRYSLSAIENLLISYRFFKEMRNAIAHNGGRAHQRAVNAFNDFTKIANTAALGIGEVPMHHPLILNSLIRLELRGVIGLSDIVLRIISTYDAALSESAAAESELIGRVSPVLPRYQLARADSKVESRVGRLVYKAGFPRPVVTPALIALLKKNKTIPHFW